MLRITLFLFALCAVGLAASLYSGALQFDLPVIRSQKQGSTPARSADRPVGVTVASVREEDVPIYLSGIGTVQAYNMVSVKTRVDGEIVKILFEEGQEVQAGDPLAIIDARPFEAQLRQQEAMRRKNQAQLDGALLDLKRYETLLLKNWASQQQVDQQRALVEQYRAQVDNDEAQIAYAKIQLDYATIRAPISGRAGIRQVDQGNIVRVSDGASIVVLTQLKPISVVFTLASSLVAGSGMTLGRARLPVIAYAADFKSELDRGTVDLVDNQVDQTTGTIKVKASFPNMRLRLWPGNFVNGRLIVATRRRGLTVPSAAVRHGPRGDFVWIVRGDKTVEARGVFAGQVSDGRTLITRGLNGGEQVVTDGHFLLEPGRGVEIIDAESVPPRGPQTSPQIAGDRG